MAYPVSTKTYDQHIFSNDKHNVGCRRLAGQTMWPVDVTAA